MLFPHNMKRMTGDSAFSAASIVCCCSGTGYLSIRCYLNIRIVRTDTLKKSITKITTNQDFNLSAVNVQWLYQEWDPLCEHRKRKQNVGLPSGLLATLYIFGDAKDGPPLYWRVDDVLEAVSAILSSTRGELSFLGSTKCCTYSVYESLVCGIIPFPALFADYWADLRSGEELWIHKVTPYISLSLIT
jgi:hypothetical protein